MDRKMPSMTALLGLLAIAVYQDRDELADMLKGAGVADTKPGGDARPGLAGLLGRLGGPGAANDGGLLGGGLSELLEQFRQNGQGETAQSWVSNGPNREVSPPQLKQVIGPTVLAALHGGTPPV